MVTPVYCTISLNVTDVDDNPPNFTQPLYTTSLDELSPVGTTLLTLSATDRDSVWPLHTAWCSEIGYLRSTDAPELRASSDVREPNSLHQAVDIIIRCF